MVSFLIWWVGWRLLAMNGSPSLFSSSSSYGWQLDYSEGQQHCHNDAAFPKCACLRHDRGGDPCVCGTNKVLSRVWSRDDSVKASSEESDTSVAVIVAEIKRERHFVIIAGDPSADFHAASSFHEQEITHMD